jgi:tRNA(fMet)-specific endonuclease VapC
VKVLLDTNAYSALMRGRAEVSDRIQRAEHVYLSTVVLGELLYGFRYGSNYENNARQLEEFLRKTRVSWVPVTRTTADRFGRIAAGLRSKGRPIPTNDIWVAAHTMETGADLLSYDRHFEHVNGLAWVFLTPS